jgi:hypothetical protein
MRGSAPGGYSTVIARTTLGRVLAVSLSIALSQIAAPLVQAAESGHIVAPGTIAARLVAQARSRDEKVRLFQDALAKPEVQKQARSMGLSPDRLRAAVPHLSDKELQDLSARASRTNDVVAGHSTNDGLAILGLVLLLAGLAVLVAVASDDYYDDGYYDDDCYCY